MAKAPEERPSLPELRTFFAQLRHAPMAEPRTKPYRLMASMAYWEQVGVKRHEGGRKDDVR